MERCLAAGMDGYVSKPLHPEELFQAIEGLIDSPSEAALPEPATSGSVLDREALCELLAEDRALFDEIHELFVRDSEEILVEIRSAVAEGSPERLEAAAHRLKGSVGNLRAAPATQKAQRLEAIGREGSLTGAGQAVQDLEQELIRLARRLTGSVTRWRLEWVHGSAGTGDALVRKSQGHGNPLSPPLGKGEEFCFLKIDHSATGSCPPFGKGGDGGICRSRKPTCCYSGASQAMRNYRNRQWLNAR